MGTPAPVVGEISVAFVIPPDPSEPPTLAELRSWVAGDLADYKTPDRLVVVDDLPLTAMMKIDEAAAKPGLGCRAEHVPFTVTGRHPPKGIR